MQLEDNGSDEDIKKVQDYNRQIFFTKDSFI